MGILDKSSVTESHKKEPATQQLTYVKVIRALAMITIVTLHVAFPLIYLYNTIDYGDWWIGNNFYIWGKMGSPLFTMVSGLLLLHPGKDQPIPMFFRKRFIKVLFPFIAWAILYLLWRVIFKAEELTGQQIITALVDGPVYYHLWFIQMILGLYLATPILRVYIKSADRSNLRYFLIIWFVSASLLPMTKRFLDIEVGIDIVVTTEYVGFFVLGYYLRDVTLQKKHILPVLLGSALLIVFTQFLTHSMTVGNEGRFDNFFVLNDSFNLILAGIGIFLFLKSLDYDQIFERLPPLRMIVNGISRCSLGIYFIHVMFIELLESGRLGFELRALSFAPILSIPITAILTLILSYLAVAIMKKIPFVKQIVP